MLIFLICVHQRIWKIKFTVSTLRSTSLSTASSKRGWMWLRIYFSFCLNQNRDFSIDSKTATFNITFQKSISPFCVTIVLSSSVEISLNTVFLYRSLELEIFFFFRLPENAELLKKSKTRARNDSFCFSNSILSVNTGLISFFGSSNKKFKFEDKNQFAKSVLFIVCKDPENLYLSKDAKSCFYVVF